MGLFTLSEETFPIVVDYEIPISEAWSAALKHVVEWGNVNFEGREFPFMSSGKREFLCSYAVLERDPAVPDRDL